MSTLSHPAAAEAAPIAAPPPLCRPIAAALRAALARLRRARRLAATRRELEQLDDATLRDIGLHRSEAGSLAAELLGLAPAGRRLSIRSRSDGGSS